MKKFGFGIVLLMVFFVGGLFFYKIQTSAVNLKDISDISISIPKGSSISNVAKILKNKGAIRSELFFKLEFKRSKDKNYKAGDYLFNKTMSNQQILDKLLKGEFDKSKNKLTIPEGMESYNIAKKIKKIGFSDEKFNYLVNNPKLFKKDFEFLNDKNIFNLEGFLFPDTYYLSKDMTEEDIVNLMLKNFEKFYNLKFREREKQMNLSTLQVIKMASIIEREAKRDDERNLISGIFYNRLEKNMKLQSCATIQYVLKERKPRLSGKDLLLDSKYNTYKYKGLPIGPISSVGIKSIDAALNPEKTDYLYFVSKNDGSHVFSKTYENHKKATKENLGE